MDREFNKDTNLSDCVDDSSKLLRFLSYKARNHLNYKYYSQKKYIEASINNRVIYLSDGSTWNDTQDKYAFNSLKCRKRYGLCLSYSKSESVAMWMLYGGKGKDGAMIDFDKSTINHILNIASINVGYFENHEFHTLKTLKKDKFSVYVYDVLYVYDNNDGTFLFKKSDNRVDSVNKSIINAFDGVIKSYPWNYENECRVIIEINRSELVDLEKEPTQVQISLVDVDLGKVNIYQAPNNTDIIAGDSIYKKSTLKGCIEWDLCKDCNMGKSTRVDS